MTDIVPEASQRISSDFEQLLDRFELQTLENETGATYALDRDLRLIYLNPAWYRFAAENGGEWDLLRRYSMGSRLGDAIQGPLKEYYLQHYHEILDNCREWQHEYECSSDTEYRLFIQHGYPVASGQILLIINSLKISHAHDVESCSPVLADEEHYRDDNGFIHQCSHCRRVQRPQEPDIWDWVAEWVANIPPDTSHTLCQPCFDYYYRCNK